MKGHCLKKSLKYLSIASIISSFSLLTYFFFGSIQDNAHLNLIRSHGESVVMLLTPEGGGGTGFFIRGASGNLVIMTNNHICDSAKKRPLTAIVGRDRFIVNILKVYPNNDLCAVEAPATINKGFRLATDVEFGERVYAIGHPLLEPLTMTQGELSSLVTIEIQTGYNVDPKDCTGATYKLLDLSDNLAAALFGVKNVCMRQLLSNSSTINILPGNSGSPIVNSYGNVVAVVFAAVDSGVHSYAVPLQDLKTFLEAL